MKTEKKLNALELVCEFAIGFTVAAVIDSVVDTKGPVSKALTVLGTTAIAFVIGGKFSKEFADVRKSLQKEV